MVCRRCLYVWLPLAIRFGGLRYPWALAAGSTLRVCLYTFPFYVVGVFYPFSQALVLKALLLCNCTTATFIYEVLLYFMLYWPCYLLLPVKKKRRNLCFVICMVRTIVRPRTCRPVHVSCEEQHTQRVIRWWKTLKEGTGAPLYYCFFQATSIIVDIYCKWILHSCTHVVCHFGRALRFSISYYPRKVLS